MCRTWFAGIYCSCQHRLHKAKPALAGFFVCLSELFSHQFNFEDGEFGRSQTAISGVQRSALAIALVFGPSIQGNVHQVGHGGLEVVPVMELQRGLHGAR